MMAIVAFGAALISSMLFVPLVREFCFRIGKVAKPREDRWHKKPTPTLGGIGIFLGFLVGVAVSFSISGEWDALHGGVLVGALIMFLLGLYDDFKRISPPAKLVGQFLAAAVVISLGYTTHFFTPRIEDAIVAQIPNILVTFFWLVGITNAINLLDNMDGLAGGIALITAAILSYFFWDAADFGLLLIAMALAGGILGFLVFNFPPASIFMGDSGSLFLGFTLALLAIARPPQASNVFAVLAVPTLLFLLPIIDTTFVTFTRLLRGQSPTQGGRDHTSHRLIAFGLSERQAVLVLYAVALVSGMMAAGLESIKYWYSLVLVPALIISLALLTAFLGGIQVVTPATSPRQSKPITRIMLELTYRRRILEVILDFFLIGVAYYLAFLFSYGFVLDENRLQLYLVSMPVALASAYISFYVFGVYRGVWRYVDFNDLMRYFQSALWSGVLMAASVFVLDSSEVISWRPEILLRVFILFAIFLFLGLAASRSSFRVMGLISVKQGQRVTEERILIVGAGDAGEMALRWILMNPQMHYTSVGFLDDDHFMQGRRIHDVEVLGDLTQLADLIHKKHVTGIILADREMLDETREQVLTISQRSGCWVRSLRLEFETVL